MKNKHAAMKADLHCWLIATATTKPYYLYANKHTSYSTE